MGFRGSNCRKEDGDRTFHVNLPLRHALWRCELLADIAVLIVTLGPNSWGKTPHLIAFNHFRGGG